ncbi:MAG: alpha-2-macroglobulin, partial [Planctomycetes bacterium]|nr:alpha-2-macroglobulin [Planctomycetota bacterium]
AKVKIHVTELNGENYSGQTVVSVYDKAVEYISGGPNAEDIKAAFWQWKRHHDPQAFHNLHQWIWNFVKPGEYGMGDIGVFGGIDHEGDEDKRTDGWGAKKAGRARGALGSPAAPMSAAALEKSGDDSETFSRDQGESGSDEPLVEAEVRSEFADTALWVAGLETDATGKAKVSLKMPDNLTTWKIRVWAMGQGTKVGSGESEIITTKNLVLRMQAPRFFTERDEVVLSANVHNYLETAKRAQVSLELDGRTLELLGDAERSVEIEAGGEARVDWRVKVLREGEAVIRMFALTDEESDAMEQRFPVHVHGMMRTESFSGVVRPDDDVESFSYRIPTERRVDQSAIEVRYSPTLAGAMVDALPYLIDYPYGCTEQTLNRFLPAVVTQKILLDMGLNLSSIRASRTNLNAQEIGDDRERAAQWRRFAENPVFDPQELAKIVFTGVERLTEMQISDGGWGWFSGHGEHSYPHTTATVVRGLLTARDNDVAIVPGVIENGLNWLERYQSEQLRRLDNAFTKARPWKEVADNLDALIYRVLAQASRPNPKMRDYLYRDRTHLAPYALALFGVGLHLANEIEKRDMVIRNLSQFEVDDDENQTLYLDLGGRSWWYWYGSEYEAQAAYLELLSQVDPKGRKASRLVKYLLNNRKHATYWNSTRDTALCLEAMATFLRNSGEDRPDMTIEVWLDGEKRKEVRVTGENLFTFDNRFALTGPAVESGEHTVEIRRRGRGPVYFNAYVSNFTLEDDIQAAGLEIKVQRKVYRLVPEEATAEVRGAEGQALRHKVEKYRRELLADGATLESGALVEVELTIDSKNDYEYLIFEDVKAAGFEPVEVRSGY